MTDIPIERSKKTLFGYYLPDNAIIVSLIGIFTALTFIATFIIQIPVPATGGYINIGDVLVMFTALLFGPLIGSISGGVGPMLADVLSGYIIYAPATLIIKGIEGFLIGYIANPKKNNTRISIYDIIAVIIGGLLLPLGYFIFEAFFLGVGIPSALIEVPGNVFQFIFAAITSILIIAASRKNIVNGFPQIFDKVFIVETS